MSNSRPLRFHGIWRAMGIGMVIVLRPDQVGRAVRALSKNGIRSHAIGEVTIGAGKVAIR